MIVTYGYPLSRHDALHSSIGFVLSVILTLIPFVVVMKGFLSGWLLVGLLVAFAIGQLLVQLVFFLHMGKGSDSRWNLIMFLRSEEHTSELQSLMRISYAVFCLKQNNKNNQINTTTE